MFRKYMIPSQTQILATILAFEFVHPKRVVPIWADSVDIVIEWRKKKSNPPLTINEPMRDLKQKKRAALEPNSGDEESPAPPRSAHERTNGSTRNRWESTRMEGVCVKCETESRIPPAALASFEQHSIRASSTPAPGFRLSGSIPAGSCSLAPRAMHTFNVRRSAHGTRPPPHRTPPIHDSESSRADTRAAEGAVHFVSEAKKLACQSTPNKKALEQQYQVCNLYSGLLQCKPAVIFASQCLEALPWDSMRSSLWHRELIRPHSKCEIRYHSEPKSRAEVCLATYKVRLSRLSGDVRARGAKGMKTGRAGMARSCRAQWARTVPQPTHRLYTTHISGATQNRAKLQGVLKANARRAKENSVDPLHKSSLVGYKTLAIRKLMSKYLSTVAWAQQLDVLALAGTSTTSTICSSSSPTVRSRMGYRVCALEDDNARGCSTPFLATAPFPESRSARTKTNVTRAVLGHTRALQCTRTRSRACATDGNPPWAWRVRLWQAGNSNERFKCRVVRIGFRLLVRTRAD
ncbi:hypothetical protein B0H11DRAFT_1914588 [Mycena galericulata]|nr:hypothetical protein B0H11DRAFT_1914588 [Mycena galericulata]